MFKSLLDLYLLLTKEQRIRLRNLQFLVILMSVLEILSIISIAPFMALVGDPSIIHRPGLLNDLYIGLGLKSLDGFLLYAGFFVLMMLAVSAFLSMITSWRLSMYGTRVGADLSSRLFLHYMHQPWVYHTVVSSSYLSSNVSQECLRITGNIINPLMQMNAKIVTGLMISIGVFLYEPVVSIFSICVFGMAYFVLYKTVRGRLVSNGNRISQFQASRFKIMAEGFGGIKDLLFMGRRKYLVKSFGEASSDLAIAQGNTQVLSQVPRYAMELIAFGGVIFLVLYLLVSREFDLGAILPVLSVFALAGFKLLPAFQMVYTGFAQIKGNISAFEAVKNDLIESSEIAENQELEKPIPDKLALHKSISLHKVCFAYPGREYPALSGLSIEVPLKSVVGIVGSSGSGKSTLVDVLLGLLMPQKGAVFIDGEELTNEKVRDWQSCIGYVPQSIFLADSSIRENVALGINPSLIDDCRVNAAVRLAHLDGVVSELPEGIKTRVGERGLQLSGGQRQRIGIARALYYDPEVLIMDEATSALDGISEKSIMEAINDFAGKKTIIMIAHRLATVRHCDKIYLLDRGMLVDAGTFEQLVDKNPTFKQMAGLS